MRTIAQKRRNRIRRFKRKLRKQGCKPNEINYLLKKKLAA